MKLSFKNHLTTLELIDLLLGIFVFGVALSLAWAKTFCLWMESSSLLTVVGWLLTVSLVCGIAMAKLNSGAEHEVYLLLLGAQIGFLSPVVTIGMSLPHTNYNIVLGVATVIVGWMIGVIMSEPFGKLAYNAFWFTLDFWKGDFERFGHPPR